MAGIRDKVVTVESLSTLHKYDKETYMTQANPTASGTMSMAGDAIFSGSLGANALMLGSNIKFEYSDGSFKILFLDEIVTDGILLVSSDGFILKDSNGIYLTTEEGE